MKQYLYVSQCHPVNQPNYNNCHYNWHQNVDYSHMKMIAMKNANITNGIKT